MPILLLGLALLAWAAARAPGRSQPAWSRHLQGWHKVFGVVALLLAMVIFLSPELMALGLLGDASFFDLLVLLLGLQVQTLVTQAWRSVWEVGASVLRVLHTRLLWDFALILLAFAPLGSLVSALHKAVQPSSPSKVSSSKPQGVS